MYSISNRNGCSLQLQLELFLLSGDFVITITTTVAGNILKYLVEVGETLDSSHAALEVMVIWLI